MSGARAVGLSYARFLAAATPTGGTPRGKLFRDCDVRPEMVPLPFPRPRLNLATGGLSNRSGTEQSVIQCPSLRRGLNAGEGACEHGTLTIHYLDWIRPVDDHPG